MTGTAGWSFTLSRKAPLPGGASSPASWSTAFKNDRTPEAIFYGRTPCREFAAEYALQPERECNKLKSELTHLRDRKTNVPAGYALQRTLERPNILTGKWAIVDGKGAAGSFILELDPDKPERTISFLVGDENVLFFLVKL